MSTRSDLGVGVIATAGLDLVWDQVEDLVDVVEVEPQTFWSPRDDTGWQVDDSAFQWLEICGKPTLVHGVGFPVGGSHAPDPAGVTLAAQCADRLRAGHWSEHLSFNTVSIDGRDLDAGFLLPPAQTWEGIEAAVEHVKFYQKYSGRPFLVETGVNYLRPRPSELSDGRFVAEIAERADCSILLDLHNLLSNQRNGRQSVADVIAELPMERVLEIHVAGGFEVDGYYLDAHVGQPDGELLAITADAVARAPNLRAVIFEAVPESMITLGAHGLRSVLESLRQICESVPDTTLFGEKLCAEPPPRTTSRPRLAPPTADTPSSDWERRLAAYTSRVVDTPPDGDRGIHLLRMLADQARLGQLTSAQPDLLRGLIRRLGIADVEKILHEYLGALPPRRWSAHEAQQFMEWLPSVTD